MKWENFTSGRVDGFRCAEGKKQSIFWDGKTPGLGLRVTTAGTKSYIFETSLKGKTLRITIGNAKTWMVSDAQAKATSYKALTDSGIDPRQVEADRITAAREMLEAKKAEELSAQNKQFREAVKLADIWPKYIEDRLPQWSELHHRDHLRIIQAGGIQRKRSKKKTEAGPLASLAAERLVDLTPERIESWAKDEAKVRPTRARLALRLLKACLTWCSEHKEFAGIIATNGANSKRARETLGKSKVKNDVLQREQLKAWFEAILKIPNPVIRSYLQILLLTGARREELATLKWEDVDFQWNSLRLKDKVEDFRMVPMPPYVKHLLLELRRRNETPPAVRALSRFVARGINWQPSKWVFSSPTAASKRLMDPSNAHRQACSTAGIEVSLHGLRRSFATLCEWTETPAGIAAQIQGHAPQGVREQNYIRRPLDLLRVWHNKFELWILSEASVTFEQVDLSMSVVRA